MYEHVPYGPPSCAGYRPGVYWQVMWRFLSPTLMAAIIGSSSYFMFTNHPMYSAWDRAKVSILPPPPLMAAIIGSSSYFMFTNHPMYSAWDRAKVSIPPPPPYINRNKKLFHTDEISPDDMLFMSLIFKKSVLHFYV
jgi:hypothetical protein